MIEERRNQAGLTEAEFLQGYRKGDYPHPALTADILLVSGEADWEILLIQRMNHPCIGCYALPGGFVEPTENAMQAAERELAEETGVTGVPLCSIGTFTDPNRDPRDWVISEAFLARVDKHKLSVQAGDDAKAAAWFSLSFRREGDRLFLNLKNRTEQLTAILGVKTVENGFGRQYVLTVLENNGLAFDHAKMVGLAVLLHLKGSNN